MKAKDFVIGKWLNTNDPSPLESSEGCFTFIHFFQMLCPGCVYHGIPLTQKIYEKYQSETFKVLAIHSVFEHHDVMSEEALKVFITEWRLPFPVGIDKHADENWMPQTMKNFNLQGTPSTLILDQENEIKQLHFGILDEEKLYIFLDNLIRRKL
jgi:thiol-disulfide isomerase/thioredoxin